MKANTQQSQTPCKNKCNRRSFILKGSQVAAGIVLIPGILKSTNLNLAQQQTKEVVDEGGRRIC